jgi:HAD superfamily hydrolase (TIGR01509 family)
LNKQPRFNQLLERARALVWDFDGVIADSEKWHFVTYSEVFARYGHTVDETEYYKYWTSLGLGASGEIDRYHLDLDPLAIREEKVPLFSGRCRDGSIKLFPQMHEILSTLSRTIDIMTIASGTAAYDIEPILENAGVRGLFTEIIGSDTVPAIKPAPDLFLAMLERLVLPGEDCLVIEDAEKGMQAANASGMPVIVIRTDQTRTFDFSDADLVLDSHDEFLTLVRAIHPA